MNDSIIHRGPDGEGVFISENLILGMRRLSIIDLPSGDQPIYNEDKRLVIVFNGEIYNYKELKRQLINKGHRFYTNSDTEVIVHLYEEKKEACLDELNGMFVFALYDTVDKVLIIARDRLGKKPLYYYSDRKNFYFASELKSIFEVVNKKFSINSEALNAYFALTFIPGPLTIYNGINKLESGCYLKIYKNLLFEKKKYWKLTEKLQNTPIITDKEEAIKTVRNILFDAVEKRMISDVPLGAFLSGGVDSSVIVSIMSKLSTLPVKTFSIGNTLKCYDESQKARIVAQLFKTEHTEWKIDNEYICSTLENVLNNFDEPFADSSALPSYVVSELASKHVKVILTGDGGDEIFGGYERYLIFQYLKLYKMIPSSLRAQIIRPIVNVVPFPASLSLTMNKFKKIINNDGNDQFEQYHAMQRLGYSEAELKLLLNTKSDGDYIKNRSMDIYKELMNGSDLSRAMYTDISIGLEGDMLVKVDRTTMQNSIEARSPFLDYRLVEMSFRLADKIKINKFRLKSIVKDAFEKEFPKGFLDRKKMGFGIPIGEFLKNELRKSMESYLSNENLNTILNRSMVKDLFTQHCLGNRHTSKLWAFYVFALWFEKNSSHIEI
jgi:asparagine synthase (glutamine-hydrolysing)